MLFPCFFYLQKSIDPKPHVINVVRPSTPYFSIFHWFNNICVIMANNRDSNRRRSQFPSAIPFIWRKKRRRGRIFWENPWTTSTTATTRYVWCISQCLTLTSLQIVFVLLKMLLCFFAFDFHDLFILLSVQTSQVSVRFAVSNVINRTSFIIFGA